MSTGLKANSDGSAAIQVGGTDVITLTSGGAATFVTSPTTVQAGTAAAPSITFSGDTNTGIYSPGADQVAIATGGSKRFEVDAAGNAGLGVTPSGWKSNYKAVQVGNAGQLVGRTDANWLYAGSNWFVNSSNQDIYQNNGNATIYTQNAGSHIWYTAPSGTAGNAITFTQVMAVEGGKSLALEGATSQSGTGITFPATQSASSNANTLDDYEEGTWTPVATGGTTPGTGTYTLQAGRYTKIGRVCFFQMTIGWNAHTGTGGLGFSGLPFIALGGGIPGQSVATIGYNNGLSYTNQPVIYIGNNSIEFYLTQTTTGGVLSGVPMDTSVTELIINGHYIVA